MNPHTTMKATVAERARWLLMVLIPPISSRPAVIVMMPPTILGSRNIHHTDDQGVMSISAPEALQPASTLAHGLVLAANSELRNLHGDISIQALVVEQKVGLIGIIDSSADK